MYYTDLVDGRRDREDEAIIRACARETFDGVRFQRSGDIITYNIVRATDYGERFQCSTGAFRASAVATVGVYFIDSKTSIKLVSDTGHVLLVIGVEPDVSFAYEQLLTLLKHSRNQQPDTRDNASQP